MRPSFWLQAARETWFGRSSAGRYGKKSRGRRAAAETGRISRGTQSFDTRGCD
jgi:hypothetical protein